jgi:predicted DCC family thiol-disulfide oxidoreductase YuxK
VARRGEEVPLIPTEPRVSPPVVNPRPEHDPRVAGTAWTGGQYSLVRALFGAWSLACFARLLPFEPRLGWQLAAERGRSLFRGIPNPLAWSDAPWLADALIVLGIVASLLFAIGAWHRIAAVIVAYLWLCFAQEFPGMPTAGVPWIVVLLVGHLLLPAAPYGAWVSRGRADPEGAWRMHVPIFQLAWGMLLLASVLGWFEKPASAEWRSGEMLARRGAWAPRPALATLAWLGIVVEGALPLLVWRKRTRSAGWLALFLWRLAVVIVGGADDRTRGLLIVQLYAFDPAWLPPLRAKAREHLFFDGTCGLCHRLVRFVAAEDRGSAFFYSPLQGEAIRGLVADGERARLPDSVVVRADDGKLITKSDATIHVLRRIGGAWRAFGATLAAVPRPLRDLGYDFVARIRKRVFRQPGETCPLLSSRLRTYFLP